MSEGYDVSAYKDGEWWTFEIAALTSPSPRGGDRRLVALGQARSAAAVAAQARALVSLWTGEEDPTVRVSYRLPADVRDALDQAHTRDLEGRAALAGAAALRRKAARTLTETGLTQADVAALMGVSRQRVQQLVA
ncbi:MAG: hypothetical protein LBG11_03070 [Bifidobacteriaceae bacterium]|jgi:aspartate/methionine/tyrosine aminotransferase|nr:hypothetical protein [Bifidobacteriaceae bacterium]